MADLLAKLADAVLLSRNQLAHLIRSAPYRYKVYTIPKRKPGQLRVIAQPAREVKHLQYWVVNHVLSQFKVHPAAMAYRRRRSIADNARAHVRGNFVLKMDFKDFFPSIKARDLAIFLHAQGGNWDHETVDALSRILFWRPRGTSDLCLAIGAPASPILSNILMREFDRHVAKFCREHGVAYTRYADDLTFSAKSSEVLAAVEQFVADECSYLKSPALTINREKTARVSKREARRVTGLTLTNDRKISLGRSEKRRIRAAVHHFATNRLSADEIIRLRGVLAYVNSVEPSFLQRLRRKYGVVTIRRCQTWPG